MPRVKINVTDIHIANGVQFKPQKCPIALALQDAGVKDAVVGANEFSIILFGGVREFPLPKRAHDWRLRFDCGEPVHAFSFEVEV